MALRRHVLRSPSMASAPNSGPSATTVIARGLAAIGYWRLFAVAMPHLAALVIMLRTEADFGSRIAFMIAWGILNFFFILDYQQLSATHMLPPGCALS